MKALHERQPVEGGDPVAGTGSIEATMARRRPHVARWTALAVGCAAVVLVSVLATRQPATMVSADSPLIGQAAPAISGMSLSGKTASLATMRGHWVLVNFFASWCDACRAEGPEIEHFLYTRPDGLRPYVLGVLYGDTSSDGRSFQIQEGATWPSVTDPGGQIASLYGVASLPHSFLVDPNGRVVTSIVGAVTSADLDKLIEHDHSIGA